MTAIKSHLFSTEKCLAEDFEKIKDALSQDNTIDSYKFLPNKSLLVVAKTECENLPFQQTILDQSIPLEKKYRFTVTGMTCPNCQGMLENLTNSNLPEIIDISAEFTPAKQTLTITTPLTTNTKDLVEAIEKDELYHAIALNGIALDKADSPIPQSDTNLHNAPLPATPSASPDYLKRSAINLGWGFGITFLSLAGLLPSLFTPLGFTLGLLASGISAGIMYGTSRDIYQKAWQAAKVKSTNMDTLIALGTTISWSVGLLSILFPTTFPGSFVHAAVESALILGVVNLTRWARAKASRRVAKYNRNIEQFYAQYIPTSARRITPGLAAQISIDDIQINDVLEVAPGEMLPVDGILCSENAWLMNEIYRGESTPQHIQAGEKGLAGSCNRSFTPIRIQATTNGKDNKLKRLIDNLKVNDSDTDTLSPTIDKIAKYFITGTIAVAAITGLAWLAWGAGAAFAAHTFLSVILCACPCSLTAAAPVAHQIINDKLAALGIHIKHASTIEKMQPQHIFFDKTGTLTMQVLDKENIFMTDKAYSLRQLLQYAASVETDAHPIGRAIIAGNGSNPLLTVDTDSIEMLSHGITAKLLDEDKRIYVGEYFTLVKQNRIVPNDTIVKQINAFYEKGNTVTCIAIAEDNEEKGSVKAILPISHQARPEARQTIQQLRAMGVTPWILTGDKAAPAKKIADELNISTTHVKWELSPEGKAEIINQHKTRGLTMMVGDGINDGPAIRAADVGVAITTDDPIGTPAQVVLNGKLDRLIDCLKLSKATTQNIHQNLAWMFFFNLFSLSFAITGAHHLLLAPLLMGASYLFIVGNALRLGQYPINQHDSSSLFPNNSATNSVSEAILNLKPQKGVHQQYQQQPTTQNPTTASSEKKECCRTYEIKPT